MGVGLVIVCGLVAGVTLGGGVDVGVTFAERPTTDVQPR